MNKIIAIVSPIDSNYGLTESAASTESMECNTVSMIVSREYLNSNDLFSGYRALYIGNN